MHPVLVSFAFLSLPMLAVMVGVYAAGRLAWSGPSALAAQLVPATVGIVAACLAATFGLVAWTGTITLTSYAVCLLLAVGGAYLLALPKVRAAGIDEQHLVRLTLIALIVGLLGARARWVWENRATLDEPIGRALLDLDSGGMVWYGGLLLASAAGGLYAWRARLDPLRLGDLAAPSLALGIAFGRIGCFLNGCCFGRVCDLPWAVIQPGHPGQPSHPTQLYETLAALILCAGLSWMYRRNPRRGLTLAAFCVGYGIWRYINEGLRDDYRQASTVSHLGPIELTNSQATSLLLLGAGLALAAWAWRRGGAQPGSPSHGIDSSA